MGNFGSRYVSVVVFGTSPMVALFWVSLHWILVPRSGVHSNHQVNLSHQNQVFQIRITLFVFFQGLILQCFLIILQYTAVVPCTSLCNFITLHLLHQLLQHMSVHDLRFGQWRCVTTCFNTMFDSSVLDLLWQKRYVFCIQRVGSLKRITTRTALPVPRGHECPKQCTSPNITHTRRQFNPLQSCPCVLQAMQNGSLQHREHHIWNVANPRQKQAYHWY